MNRHTIENVIIFAVTFCETYNFNNGKLHYSYIDEKSRKYIGIDLSDYPKITIDDFGYKLDESYYPSPIEKIFENISGKINLSKLIDYNNIIDDGLEWDGSKKQRIKGLDFHRQSMAFDFINQLDDDFFKQLSRDYNVDILLSENED